MSQALLLRVIALEVQHKALIERLARLEIAMQNVDPQLIASTAARMVLDSQHPALKPKEREWPTSRKS